MSLKQYLVALFYAQRQGEGIGKKDFDRFAEAPQLFSECLKLLDSTTAASPKHSQVAMVSAVLELASSAVVGKYSGFPGPMCSPFRRSHSAMLREGDGYTFTEKSDGMRVLVVSLRVQHFPRWTLRKPEGKEEDTEPSGVALLPNFLPGVMSLENAQKELRESSAHVATVQLGGQAFTLEATSTPEGEGFLIKDLKTVRWRAARHIGQRHIAYLLDRSLTCAYILFGEYSLACDHCVLDGELMKVVDGSGRVVLGLFDLYSYKQAGEAEVRLTDATMSARYLQLQHLVHGMHCAGVSTSPAMIQWFVKDMWPLDRIGDCLERLERRGVREYIFHGPCGPTKNDGFVFTPESFAICGGASRTQLKWKWPSLLSIDWLISPAADAGAGAESQLYDAWLFFRKKNFNFRDDVEGHWKFTERLDLLNLHHHPLPAAGTRVVAECVYVEDKKQWAIERFRLDKKEANSIVTAISVYESLVENICLPELCAILGVRKARTLERVNALAHFPDVPSAASSAPSHTNVRRKDKMHRLMARLALRAITKGDASKLSLHWFTNRTNPACRKNVPCALCEVHECAGLGLPCASAEKNMEADSLLTSFLHIQLGNAGGSYAWSDFTVDAYFDGTKAHWVIVRCHPHGKNYECIFDGVLQHLSWILAEGHGDAARKAIPLGWYDPPAVIPRIVLEETKLTNAHYARKAAELGNTEKERSALRRFNNWIKSALITQAVQTARERLGVEHLVIADVCCGRGGDLLKWAATKPAFLFMTDASLGCVAAAAARYSTGKGLSLKSNVAQHSGFPAYFAVHDAFDHTSGLQETLLRVVQENQKCLFHLCSCQFSLHYGCASLERVETFVAALAASLEDGGLFIGSTLCDATLLGRFHERGTSFGNAYYHIRFPGTSAALLRAHHAGTGEPPGFGVQYFATVENVVSEMPAYVVPWDLFSRVCRKYGLHQSLDQNFQTFFAHHSTTEAGQELMEVVKRSRNGLKEITLTPEELEVASLYRVFIFEKKTL